ncbi:MAG: tetratricopeptide repeat protein [Planctomycetes bacterium]|nr:tetratricopeptide repeat protein [Planctomycetota bacterium]
MKLIGASLVLLLAACAAPPSAPSDASYRAGLTKIASGDAGGAIDDLTRSIDLDPNNSMAFNWRGHCFNLLGYPEEALLDYDRAIELDPTYAWSHYARGMAHHNLGRFQEAIAGYSRALALDPSMVKAWNWRGFTRKLSGDYSGAASDLEHSLTLVADDTWTLFELAKSRQALGDLDACARLLERIVALDPTHGSARAQLGFLTAVRGETLVSIAHFEAACALRAPEETYARIWIWMQRSDRLVADREWRAWFTDARIVDPWEQEIAAFIAGEGGDERLASRAAEETADRVSRGLPRDFLACEAAFYSGLRHELWGELEAAQTAYGRAQRESAAEAWEWHLASLRASPARR